MSLSGPERKRNERTRNLARWNELLSGHVDEERAKRLANHPAFQVRHAQAHQGGKRSSD
jgi:hypothetical protein